MPWIRWHWLAEFRRLWEPPLPEPTFRAARILKIQRSIVQPAKLVILAVVFYYLFFSEWMTREIENGMSSTVFENLRIVTIVYILFSVGVACLVWIARQFPLSLVQWVILVTGLVDGAFLAAMMLIKGGFESTLFWAFPGLIVINALSIPLAAPQLILNLSLSAFYMGAGIIYANIALNTTSTVVASPKIRKYAVTDEQAKPSLGRHDFLLKNPRRNIALPPGSDVAPEIFLLRLIVLWLLTACCYGVQVLAARQRQAEEEAREFAARQGQLRTAGRLAAEIAHQVKNPLAIINNTAFSLRRALAAGKTDVSRQLQIIQEEIERSDRIITQLMGYARLAEGRVEKLSVTEELDRAIAEVFPALVGYEVKIQRDYAADLPTLVMQRGHLNTVLVNLLLNAREALDGHGHVSVGARLGKNFSVEIVIQDDGPGIPAEQSERIFEAYFTTKEKGTGLGLAIVKHNVDLYGGTIHVESELGKGARFVIAFPAKALNESTKAG